MNARICKYLRKVGKVLEQQHPERTARQHYRALKRMYKIKKAGG